MTTEDPTIIHKSPFHTFKHFLLQDGQHRYELTVKLPFGLGWYNVFINQPLKMTGQHLKDLEAYLWAQACIGIGRDVQRVNELINR